MRRAAAVLLVAVLLGLVGAGPAAAAPAVPVPAAEDDGLGLPFVDLPSVDGLLEQLCPSKEAPYPQRRISEGSPELLGQVPLDRQSLYAQYGYGGLRWTTYEQSCVAGSRFDTSIGTGLSEAANTIDELVNEVQSLALDVDADGPLDRMVAGAMRGLAEAFWGPWLPVALAAVGVVCLVAAASGRAAAALGVAGNAAAVLVGVSLLLAQPQLLPEWSNALTRSVTSGTASTLIDATGGSQVPTAQALPEGYYRVSYRAWLDGAFCGDAAAERKYGQRLLEAQAFSKADLARIAADPQAEVAIVEGKRASWLALAEQMKAQDPGAFGCWSGDASSRLSAGIRHLTVSVFAGFFVLVASAAVPVLQNVLLLGLLFVVAMGAWMLLSRRLTGQLVELLLLGFVGAPAVALGAGVLLFGYYAILSDAEAAWYRSVIAAVTLGVALLVARGPLRKVLTGATVAEGIGGWRGNRRGGHRRSAGGGSSVATAAVAGAVAGSVARQGDEQQGDGGGGDGARADAPPVPPSAQVPDGGGDAARTAPQPTVGGTGTGQGPTGPQTGVQAPEWARGKPMVAAAVSDGGGERRKPTGMFTAEQDAEYVRQRRELLAAHGGKVYAPPPVTGRPLPEAEPPRAQDAGDSARR